MADCLLHIMYNKDGIQPAKQVCKSHQVLLVPCSASKCTAASCLSMSLSNTCQCMGLSRVS